MIRKVAVIVLYAVTLVSYANPAVNKPGGPPWPSGAGQTDTASEMSGWEGHMGHPLDLVVAWAACANDGYGSGGTWTNWSNQIQCPSPANALANLPPTTTLVISYPMFPNDADPGVGGSQNTGSCNNLYLWDDAAAGDFDSFVSAFALALKNQYVARRPNDPTGKLLALRWGWEMNGAWYAWSICTKVSEFKAYWARSVPLFRAQLPDMKFDFSPARNVVRCASGNCSPTIRLEDFAPDPQYWDIVTRSLHDASPATTSAAAFITNHVNASGANIGLDEVCDLAQQHGKKCGLSEWSTQMADCSANFPTAPNPSAFIQGTWNWLNSRASLIGWDAYFSTPCARLYERQTTDAAKTYKSLWGNGQSSGGGEDAAPSPPNQVTVE